MLCQRYRRHPSTELKVSISHYFADGLMIMQLCNRVNNTDCRYAYNQFTFFNTQSATLDSFVLIEP